MKKEILKIKSVQKLKNNLAAWLLLLPLILIMYLWVWRPTVMGMVWSTFKMKGYTPKEFIGLKNYIDVVTDTEFFPILWNTLKYVLYSLIVGFVPPVFVAIMINEIIHCKNTFRVIIYLPAVIPGIAANLMWYFLYYPDETGLLNQIMMQFGASPYAWLNDAKFTILYIVIAMTWSGFGGTMILYYAALQSVSRELYEAATIDGAGMVRRLWYVTLPQIAGVLVLCFVNQIITVFQVLDQPMVMTGGGPKNASISIGFQLYRYGFVNGRAGHAMALGTIIFLILIIVTCFYFYANKKIEENY
jgi:multiple sugar transport system permease protein